MADYIDVLASLVGGGLATGTASGQSPIGLPSMGSGIASPIGLPGMAATSSPIGLPSFLGGGGEGPVGLPFASDAALKLLGRPTSADTAAKPGAKPAAGRQAPPGIVPASVPAEYQGMIQEAAARYGVDPALLAAQLRQENNFQPRGTSSAGAQGIAQFIPSTARQYNVDVNDPRSSIQGMAHYMSDLLQQYNGNQREALAAYNGGPGAVQALRAGQPYGETATYLAKVQGYLEAYRGESAAMAGTALAAPATAGASGYVFPVQGYRGTVNLHHGSVRGGSDIMAPEGTPVLAMRGGVVELAATGGPGGNYVQIRGDDGNSYYYAHLRDAPQVRPGMPVGAGQVIGAVGRTGNAASTPPHLHIGVGPSIVSGVGPTGGTGGNFDAITLLQQALAGQ